MTDILGLIDPALLTPGVLAFVAFAIFVSAVLRGLTGFGFALAAVPMLSLDMPPARAVPLVLWLAFLGGFFYLPTAVRQCHWPSLRWMQVGALIGTPLGVVCLTLIPAPAARVVIAVLTAAAVAALGRGFVFTAMPGRSLTAATGLLAGIFGGLAAMPGPPAVAYYTACPLNRVQIRASLLVFFTAVTPVALVSAIVLGLLTLDSFVMAVLALPVMYAGQIVGQWAFKFGSDTAHKRVAIVCLALIALSAAVKGVSEFF